MSLLAIDQSSVEWRRVVEYLKAREEVLLGDALNLKLSNEERRDAVARIHEVRTILEAPAQTLRVTAQRLDDSGREITDFQNGRVY